jgi:glycerophosphoryl diester phosphodiesterase
MKAAVDYRSQRDLWVDPERGIVRTRILERPPPGKPAPGVKRSPSGLQRTIGLARRLVSGIVHAVMDLIGLFVDWKAALGKPPTLDRPVGVVGHRGSPSKKVENTIESFEEAVTVDGADVVETDLVMTKDGEVLCWHDWDPDSLISFIRQRGGEAEMAYRPRVPPSGDPRRVPVNLLTEAEFRGAYGYATVARGTPVEARIPTVRELFEWAKTRPACRGIVLDVKLPADDVDLVPALVARVLEAFAAVRPDVTLYWLTPQSRVLRAMQPILDGAFVSLDVEIPGGVVVDFDKYSAVIRAQSYGNRFASVGRPQVTVGGWPVYRSIVASDAARLARLREEGKDVPSLFCWTINKRSEMKDLLSYSVDGMLTDHPARLRRLLEKGSK